MRIRGAEEVMMARCPTILRVFESLMGVLALGSMAVGQSGPVGSGFTSKPRATRSGDNVRIEFAVDRETDVCVAIENAGGKIVRHLVAGVLGKNPPEPLQA